MGKRYLGNICTFPATVMSYYEYFVYKMSSCHFPKEKIDCHNIHNRDENKNNLELLYHFISLLQVKYKEDYEKNKGKADYNVLPASENPLLKQLMAAGNRLSDVSIFLSKVFCFFFNLSCKRNEISFLLLLKAKIT